MSFANIVLKLGKVGPAFSSSNPCSSVARDDRKYSETRRYGHLVFMANFLAAWQKPLYIFTLIR